MVFSNEVYSTFIAMSSRTLLSDHVQAMLNKISPVSDRAGHRIRARRRDSDGSENEEKVEERKKKNSSRNKNFLSKSQKISNSHRQ